MMFDFMRTVALLVFNTIYTVGESSMFSLPKILALRNTRVHVGFLNDYNVLFYIEISVNKTSSLCTILRVLNINPHNSHIGLGKSLDDTRIEH